MDGKYGYYDNWTTNNETYNGLDTVDGVPMRLVFDRRTRRPDFHGDVGPFPNQYFYPYQPPNNFLTKDNSHDLYHRQNSRRHRKDDMGKDNDATASGSEAETLTSTKKGVRRVARRFAENCSMQGPPYILNSTWWLSRSLWILFLLGAMAVMVYHLIYLFNTYLLYDTKNKVELGFSSLQFPAITVCNVNPVRQSMLGNLSEDFQRYVAHLDPEAIGRNIEAHADGSVRRRRAVSSDDSVDDEDDEDNGYETQLDDIDFGIDFTNFSNAMFDPDDSFFDDDNFEGYSSSWESEATDSKFRVMEEQFRNLYSAESRKTRRDAGHKIKDMLVSCSFAGKSCYARNFTLSTSTTFGNCYTLQYDKFISKHSGPTGGLELIFFLDTEEYVRGVTPGDGLQLVVHPRNTMPFPLDESVAVAAGTHTQFSMKLIQIQRESEPYNTCSENSGFFAKYGYYYTRLACQKFCQQNVIHKTCGCRDETEEDLNRVMQSIKNYPPCRNETAVKCMAKVEWKYTQGLIDCAECDSPCFEKQYEKSVSFKPWPHEKYAESILVKTICKRDAAKCLQLQNKDGLELSKEFVKLNIFFENLNYENITELPDYELVQFVSDIGGTLGLWIGLSVLSIMEVLQFFVELLRFLCCCRWRENSQPRSRGS